MNKMADTYKALIERFPLQPIQSDADLDAAHKVAKPLFLRISHLTLGEEAYLHVLSMLVHDYETKAHPLPDKEISPVAMLQFLMDSNGLKQTDLTHILGISSGRASELVNGVRELSKTQIGRLADFFKVSTDLFLSKTLFLLQPPLYRYQAACPDKCTERARAAAAV